MKKKHKILCCSDMAKSYKGRPQIVRKSGFNGCHFWTFVSVIKLCMVLQTGQVWMFCTHWGESVLQSIRLYRKSGPHTYKLVRSALRAFASEKQKDMGPCCAALSDIKYGSISILCYFSFHRALFNGPRYQWHWPQIHCFNKMWHCLRCFTKI